MAIRVGLYLALETSLVSALVESNALAVVSLIASKVASTSNVGISIKDILYLLQNPCFSSINFVPRNDNKMAHGLTKLALDYNGKFVWFEDCPLSVESLVLGDCPNSL